MGSISGCYISKYHCNSCILANTVIIPYSVGTQTKLFAEEDFSKMKKLLNSIYLDCFDINTKHYFCSFLLEKDYLSLVLYSCFSAGDFGIEF